jgi:Mg-chelatase subunit ChlD
MDMRTHPAKMAMGLAMSAFMVIGTAAGAVGATAEEAETKDCIAEVEPNDDMVDAVTFEGERCISGKILEIGDVDVFVWRVSEADAETTWSLQLEGVSETVTEATLSRLDDGAEEETARVQVDAEQEVATTQVGVESGTYALVVHRPDDAAAAVAPEGVDYQVRLARATSMEPEPEEVVAAEETARIAVVTTDGSDPRIGPAVALELVLDTSGSMLERLGKATKLEIAQRTLVDLVDELPSGTPVALRTFKAKPRSCATVLRVPLEPLRPKAMKETIRELPARKGTRTPIARAVRKAGQDLSTADGHHVLVLVTDGKEDCGGDPAAAIEAVAEAGTTATVHLIGYALPDDEQIRTDLAAWAALGGGRFWEATNRGTLRAALEGATTTPYLVFDAAGVVVAQGLVGDEGVEVEAGVYRVEVPGDPPTTFDAVEIEAGADIELSLTPPTAAAS